MGLHVSIIGKAFENGKGRWISELTITNIDGPFKPSETAPAAILKNGRFGSVIAVLEDSPEGMVGPMAGGAFITTSDSRFSNKLRDLGLTNTYVAIPLHDRFEKGGR